MRKLKLTKISDLRFAIYDLRFGRNLNIVFSSFSINALLVILLFVSFTPCLKCQDSVVVNPQVYNVSSIKPSYETQYIVKLVNGDIISGNIVEVNDQGPGEKSIKVKTEIGTAVVYAGQIFDVLFKSDEYRHEHRVFLMPTAEPIANDFFVGDFEMMFLYAGFGISDIASFTFGRTVIPFIPASQQISSIDAKFTVYSSTFDSLARNYSLAVGGNVGWANAGNQIIDLYAAGTINFGRTALTGNIFYKTGGRDIYDFYLQNNLYEMFYPGGTFGIGLAVDSKLPKRNDIHIIGEIWNFDVNRPSHSAIFLGTRICNTTFSADFGFAVFSQPYLLPFTSFVWTPF